MIVRCDVAWCMIYEDFSATQWGRDSKLHRPLSAAVSLNTVLSFESMTSVDSAAEESDSMTAFDSAEADSIWLMPATPAGGAPAPEADSPEVAKTPEWLTEAAEQVAAGAERPDRLKKLEEDCERAKAEAAAKAAEADALRVQLQDLQAKVRPAARAPEAGPSDRLAAALSLQAEAINDTKRTIMVRVLNAIVSHGLARCFQGWRAATELIGAEAASVALAASEGRQEVEPEPTHSLAVVASVEANAPRPVSPEAAGAAPRIVYSGAVWRMESAAVEAARRPHSLPMVWTSSPPRRRGGGPPSAAEEEAAAGVWEVSDSAPRSDALGPFDQPAELYGAVAPDLTSARSEEPRPSKSAQGGGVAGPLQPATLLPRSEEPRPSKSAAAPAIVIFEDGSEGSTAGDAPSGVGGGAPGEEGPSGTAECTEAEHPATLLPCYPAGTAEFAEAAEAARLQRVVSSLRLRRDGLREQLAAVGALSPPARSDSPGTVALCSCRARLGFTALLHRTASPHCFTALLPRLLRTEAKAAHRTALNASRPAAGSDKRGGRAGADKE